MQNIINCRTDELAMKGNDLNIPVDIKLEPEDISQILKSKFHGQFYNDWQRSLNFKDKLDV